MGRMLWYPSVPGESFPKTPFRSAKTSGVSDQALSKGVLPTAHTAHMQNLAENVAAQEVAALLSINAQRVNLAQEQNIIVQAPEDSKDVVAAAKRVISQNRVNALGLRDQRDMTRLIAQSALQVKADSLRAGMLDG